MAKVFTITEGLENMGALRTGGQGSVYKGKRMGFIISAVKLLPTPIHTENKDDKNFRDFQNEVEKLKKVNEDPSPNVVKILNSGLTESGSFPFIEMEYIEGPDLEELLKPPHSAVFSIREAIKLADQLSGALAHCHKVGVKHGDIKSNNIKFNQFTGNYVLLDFGLSVMSDEQRRTSLRHAGAVEFMSPEQHEGEMLFQSDIYSFGIILYELLAGTVPFPLINKSESSRNTVMLSHIEKALPDLLELRKAHLPSGWTEEKKAQEMLAPAWLLQIISKCLEKNPGNRFANGMELHEAICNHHQVFFSNEEAAGIINELRNENDRLNKQLIQLNNTGKVKIITIIGIVLVATMLIFGLNAAFDKNDDIKSDSTAVVDGDGRSAKDTVDAKKPANATNTNSQPASKPKKGNQKKAKKTKDGLVDDVPEF
ncbi:serine/threonine protein kinase [Pedobacter psychroterrae]|uniref:Serine/threonine protein kinase n=1 Tax=Pedobacter psychroterrae TaxID=2530453 RepID=A0A4R0NUR3_9SPHI|nr:serine/threonine-protein kinase [Pedobacter psychroterrae]TCD03918.1 serine/threonine protein kinase [Pedobacter psychroterrae]